MVSIEDCTGVDQPANMRLGRNRGWRRVRDGGLEPESCKVVPHDPNRIKIGCIG